MRLFVDLDSRQFVTAPGVRQTVAQLAFTRGDDPDVQVQFVRDGVIVDLGTPTLFFCIKQAGDYDGDPLVFSEDFTKSGSGDTAAWTAQPNFNTEELNEALGVGAGTDKGFIIANVEIGFVVSGRQTTTRPTTVRLDNDLYRGTEGVPTSGAPAYPSPSALQGMFDDEEAARIAGDAAIVQRASAANSTGDTTITFPAGCRVLTVDMVFTGAAGTRILVADTSGLTGGEILRLDYTLPATAGIVVELRNATTGGTLLDTLTTDATGDSAFVELTYSGTVFQFNRAQYPAN